MNFIRPCCMLYAMTEEWFDLVDVEGKVIGHAPRTVCHGNPGLTHRAVHVLVFNCKGQLFLQKRSATKDVQPGKWDTSVGGHPRLSESNPVAAARELTEELGVVPGNLVPAYSYAWKSSIETELITTFATRHGGPFSLDPGEIADGRFWDMDEIRGNLGRDVFTPQFENEFPRMIPWADQDE